MSIERKPHKHAEVIRKWADGAQIQYSHNGVDWKDVLDNLPGFYSHTQYRLKPSKVRYRVAVFMSVYAGSSPYVVSTQSEDEANEWEKINPQFNRWLSDWQETEV